MAGGWLKGIHCHKHLCFTFLLFLSDILTLGAPNSEGDVLKILDVQENNLL